MDAWCVCMDVLHLCARDFINPPIFGVFGGTARKRRNICVGLLNETRNKEWNTVQHMKEA